MNSEIQRTSRFFDGHTRQWKTMTLAAEEFLRRYLQHVLPEGFHKVRYLWTVESGKPQETEKGTTATGGQAARKATGRAGCGHRPHLPLLRKGCDGGHRTAAAPVAESTAGNRCTTDRRGTTMKRARRKNTPFTLPVRPLYPKKPFIAGQRRKNILQITRKSSKEMHYKIHSSDITIDTVSFCGYYPHCNEQNSR